MISIWNELKKEVRGKFYVSSEVKTLRQHNDTQVGDAERSQLVAGWGDYREVKGDIIYMEMAWSLL